MTEPLEQRHLVDEHRVPEVQVGRGRVEAGLDAQRLAALQLLLEIGLEQDFGGAAAEFGELFLDGEHCVRSLLQGTEPPDCRDFTPSRQSPAAREARHSSVTQYANTCIGSKKYRFDS